MRKRIVALALAVALLFSCLPGALAASITVYVVENTLKVYKEASSSSKVLGTMAYGESMTCLSVDGSWAKVKNSAGATGYCKTSGLDKSDPNTLDETLYVKNGGAKVYKRPSSSSDVLMTLRAGSGYTAVAITEDRQWVRLKNGKYYGYVQAKYLSDDEDDAGDAGETVPGGTTVYVSANTAPVYKGASSSTKLLGTMAYGESMTLVSIDGSWAKVKNGAGTTGYCRLSALSTSDPNELNDTVYLERDGVRIYQKPVSGAKVLATGNAGDKLTAVAETPDGEWLRVKKSGSYGYVLVYLVTDEAPEQEEDGSYEGGTVYVAANTLKVYKEAGSSSKLLGTMSYGESMTLVALDDSWAKVKNGAGATGYCQYGGLSTANPNSEDFTAYARQDGVKVYAKPLSSAKALKTLDRNDRASIVAVTPDGDWARAYLGSGSYGYIETAKLSTKQLSGTDAEISLIQDIRSKTVYIADTNLSFYDAPSSSAEAVAVLSFGDALSCNGEGGGWSRVVNGGKTAYCKTASLTETNPNKYSVTLYAKEDGVKLYARASKSATVLGTLSTGVKLTGVAISPDEDWIRLKNGSEYGYVRAADVDSQQSGADSETVAAVISLAKAQLGKKYVYGASGSSQFDCSSLTQYVYANAAGIKLYRLAQQQGYDSRYERITSVSRLQKGDLVFFNTNDTDSDVCDHVGIYIGSSQFIHASSAAGKVITSSLSSGYYSRTFSWGMRVL